MFTRLATTLRFFARSQSMPIPRASIFSPKSHLLETLKSEIDFELKLYKSDLKIFEFLKKTGFEISDSSKSPIIKLTKLKDNFKVVVAFEADQGVRFLDNTAENTEVNNSDDEEISGRIFDFFVGVLNTETRQGVAYNCIAHRLRFNVDSIAFLDQVDNESEKYKMTKGDYHGPRFSTLDTNVQELLLSYLEDSGVNNELIAFIAGVTVDKRKRLVMSWMKNIYDMLYKY